MTQNIPEVPARDDNNGDDIESLIGGPVEPDHDVDLSAAEAEAGDGGE